MALIYLHSSLPIAYPFFASALVVGSNKVIGIDLEHCAEMSYRGFTCLIQISTNEMNYAIDTLALHYKMSLLNYITRNPNIVKVFHNADSDINWLQVNGCRNYNLALLPRSWGFFMLYR